MSAVHARRRERLRRVIAQAHPDRTMIVTDLANVRYLTGFSGSNAVLVIGNDADDDLMGTDGRYTAQVAEQAPDLPVTVDRDTLAVVARRLAAVPVLVEGSLSVAAFASLREAGLDPVVAGNEIHDLRAVKDDTELLQLAKACSITALAFSALAAEIRVGATEVALARRLEQLFGEFGAEDRAFDTIVGSGPHSAVPHHQPGARRLQAGDLVVIDAGARVAGYHADMTRTFVVAAEPRAWQDELHRLVRDAQAAAIACYLPGADRRGIDSAARDVIADAGHGDDFGHGLGHGVGLEIHEAPMIGPRATGTIDAHMAITVEPGVYLTGRGGVRIEDTLVVTDAGPRILTEAPRELVVVG